MTIGKQTYKNYRPAGMEAGVLPIVENSRVLEIGFGSGALMKALAARGNDVYGVDAGEDIVAKAKEQGFENVWLVDVSEEQLPFEDDSFDAVYCYEVFEHLTNPHRLFYEIRRVLKLGECLYFSTPAQEKTMGYGPGRHSFVYPGLLERENLERFFMQMYFRIEDMVEVNPDGLIVSRSYILKNMKDEKLPDIVEVIAGDYSVKALYRSALTPEALEKEIEREVEPYLRTAEKIIIAQNWEKIDTLLSILLGYYPDYFPMYTRLAALFLKHGHRETARSVLQALLNNKNVPAHIMKEASVIASGIS